MDVSYQVTQFETTPNPNAVKCWLDKPISDMPRSFLNPDMAQEDPIARKLFSEAGATCVLFNGDWLTVNKAPEADWQSVKQAVRQILSEAGS